MSEPLLTINGLAAGYGSTEVLRDIDLAVDPGEIIAISEPTVRENRRSTALSPA